MKFVRLLGVMALSLVVVACSLAQRPTLRPTLAPIPTLAPDATPPPTPAPCPGAPELPDGQGVNELVDFPLAEALEVADVAWTGTRLVAVGFRPLPGEGYDGPRQGLVWTSCDGVAWQEYVDPIFQYVTPSAVAALGEDVYVMGTLSTCGPTYEGQCEDVAEAGNVITRSVAGAAWQRLPSDPEMQTAFDLAFEAVGGRLVAYGTPNDKNAVLSLWSSANGESWSKTTNVAGMETIYALVAQGEGMIAFGDVYREDIEDTTLVVATSADGSAFTAVSAPDLPGATIFDAVQGPGGYAAVGVAYPETKDFGVVALALRSADGTTWTEASATDDSFGDSQLDNVHVLPDATGYVAVGYRLDADDFTSQLSELWISTDGASWRSLQQFGSSTSVFTTSAMGPYGLVVFSSNEDETAEEIETGVSVYFVPTAAMAP
jgi:hypothetical protein